MVSSFANGRDPNIYPEPEAFRPERWLRGHSEAEKHIHNFAWLPFGFGPRMCIGMYAFL